MAIKVDKHGDALMLRVRSRINWLAILCIPLILLIIWGVGIQPACDGLANGMRTGGSIGGYILGIGAAGTIFLFLLYRLLLELFGSEVILAPGVVRW
jgi:hypothetical protein